MPDIPLEDRVDAAFPPNDRDNTHLAALDIRKTVLEDRDITAQLRRLLDGTTELP